MKKVILMAATFFCLATATAQTTPTEMPATSSNPQTNGFQAPSVVTQHYGVDYPNTTATWYKDGSNYRAEYMDSKTNMGRSVTYDKNGVRIGTEEQLSSGNYPAEIGTYYTGKYPNEEYQVWSSVDGTGKTTYYTNRSSETIWFDNSGKYKSKTKKKTYSTEPKK